MPTSFTSYWGSGIHGVEVKWTCDTAVTPNVLTAEMTSNYYWRTQLYYDSNEAGDADILAGISGASSLNANFGTDVGNVGTTALGTWKAVSSTVDKFKMQLFIANPTAGATVTFDGFNGAVWFNYKRGQDDGVTYPQMRVEWLGSVDGQALGTAHNYDMQPSDATTLGTADTTDNWRLLSTEAIHDDANTQVSSTGTDLCVEQWVYSNTAVACMKVKGTFERNMATSTVAGNNSVADTTNDFDFDFVDHQISATIGKDPETGITTTLLNFAAVTVPFSTFIEPETTGATSIASSLFATAIAFYTAF